MTAASDIHQGGPGQRRSLSQRAHKNWLPGAAAGLALGLLALGPGAGRGYLLSYDMVFVPRESFTAAVSNSGLTGAVPPRAVPSDLVVAALSAVLPGDIVQKIALLAVFVLACAGVTMLLDREPWVARLAGGVFYAWNPYVAERLIIGQWALLLGYAGLPWVLRALRAPVLASRRGAGRLALAMLPAAIGGFAGMIITAILLVPVALARRETSAAQSFAGVAVAAAVWVVLALPWLIPSLLHAVYADPAGVAAFAARPDTPFGSLGSLLMLGGIWNAQAVPRGYGGYWSAIWLAVVLAALTGYVTRGWRQRRWPGLEIAAIAGLAIGCVGVTAAGRAVLRYAIEAWPAFGVLRDGQQFIAPLALLAACGAGLLVGWAVRPNAVMTEDLIFGVAGILAPLVLLPGLAWGAGARLRPADYPAAWLAAAAAIDASPAGGDVLVLPWASYRAPGWNHGQTVLDPWPRLVARPVIWNDGTEVGSIVMAPDDPRARALTPALSSTIPPPGTTAPAGPLVGPLTATGPLTGALRSAGVRFVVADAPVPGLANRLPGAVAVFNQAGLLVYAIPAR